jgi:hypothetical protein
MSDEIHGWQMLEYAQNSPARAVLPTSVTFATLALIRPFPVTWCRSMRTAKSGFPAWKKHATKPCTQDAALSTGRIRTCRCCRW